jgi:hypothetical protein
VLGEELSQSGPSHGSHLLKPHASNTSYGLLGFRKTLGREFYLPR